MKMVIMYEHAGVAGEVLTLPADFIAWERITKSKFSDLWVRKDNDVELRIGLEDLAILTWSVLKRQGKASEPFEIWLESLDIITDFEEYEANPTQPEASTDSGSFSL
jgi:hypothetical protein